MPFVREAYPALKPLGQAAHATVMRRFREYMLVGGMPQAVAKYVSSKDFAAVDEVKRGILRLYAVKMSLIKSSLTVPLAWQNQHRWLTGDMNTSIIKTAKGRTIMMQFDTSTPRPYSRINLVQGTKGCYDFPITFENACA